MTETNKKARRPSGDGSIHLRGRVFWITYKGPDGKRRQESTHDSRRGVAQRLLQKRIGARLHNLPVIPNAEQLTFYAASQMVIDDFTVNRKKSLTLITRRIDKHLRPYFNHCRLASLMRDDIISYIKHRQTQGVVSKHGHRVRDVSNAQINRELQILKRTFSLAIKSGKIAMRPDIPMLEEDNVRAGFFEATQLASVLAHLPDDIRPVIEFAALTGWRINSEVLTLEWRQVDFDGAEVRLDPGSTKNKQGRKFPFTTALKTLLEQQWAEHKRLQKAGHLCASVFFREVAEERGGEKKPRAIKKFEKEWKRACRDAGCPGRIPHDLRRTAVRNFVRSGIPDSIAMKLTGHKTRSVFDRYDITSSIDFKDAARRLDDVAQRQCANG